MAVLMSIRYMIVSILIEVYGIKIRAGLSLLTYMFLFLSCLSWLRIMRKVSLIGMLKNRGMKYLCYSIIDTQANYTRISAQSYTTLISVQLLFCFSIPVVLVLSWIYLKSRYQLSHIFGLVAGIMSIVVIVWLDVRDGKGGVTVGGGDRLYGDLLSLLSASLTGVSQVIACYSIQDFHPSEYLGMLGLWGAVISAGQIFWIEQPLILSFPWHIWEVPALVLSFSLAQIIYYICFPTALKICTPAGLNLSLLSTNFYSLGAATFVFKYKFNLFYLVGAALVLGGNITFCWKSILNADDISSSGGSSSGSGDTEVCSEPGSCDMELDIPIQDSPPYFNRTVMDSRPNVRDNNRIPQVTRLEYCK